MRTVRMLTISPSMLCTGGCTCSWGVSALGVYLVLGGVCSRGVYLVRRGVPGPEGVCSGGCTWSRGGVCSRGCLLWGVYLAWGCAVGGVAALGGYLVGGGVCSWGCQVLPPPCEQNLSIYLPLIMSRQY